MIGICSLTTDITEMKQAEMALRKSEETLADAQAIAHIGSWHWDIPTDSLISCSAEYARIHGVPMDKIQDHLAHQMERALHPDDRERVQTVFGEFDEAGADYEIEYRVIRPDGEVRDVVEIGKAVRNLDRSVKEQIGTLQDITERKQAQQALAEREAQIISILDNAPALISLKDREGRYVLVNQSWRRAFMPDAGDPAGKRPEDVLHEDVTAASVPLDNKVRETGKPASGEESLRFAGDEHFFQTVKFPIPGADGEITGIGTISTDITLRKRDEERLRTLSRITEQNPASIIVTDTDGTIKYTNAAFERITGHSTAQAIGLQTRIFKSGKRFFVRSDKEIW